MGNNFDLFGNKITDIPSCVKKRKKNLFDDYEGFIEKFKTKKTTDDCYTPKIIYECILKYISEKVDISGLQIVRPFYPGGDYENFDYPIDSVVIDNPPFSIIAKIARFYISNGIKFFLFAPHMTLFSSDIDCTAIVVGASITYENGAKVRTSFLSNLFGDVRIMSDAEMFARITSIEKSNYKPLPKYRYPPNLLTVSALQTLVSHGISLSFKKEQVHHCSALDSQKKYKKAIFGAGFLLSEKAAAEKAEAEKAVAEKIAAEKKNKIEFELSEREKKSLIH